MDGAALLVAIPLAGLAALAFIIAFHQAPGARPLLAVRLPVVPDWRVAAPNSEAAPAWPGPPVLARRAGAELLYAYLDREDGTRAVPGVPGVTVIPRPIASEKTAPVPPDTSWPIVRARLRALA